MAPSRVHITVYGEVQGVFFRSGAKSFASSLGITGWARNKPDGTVEIVAEGSEENIKKLVAWCSEGPDGASVSRVDAKKEKYKGEFSFFSVEYR
jgi:acylphosphatase